MAGIAYTFDKEIIHYKQFLLKIYINDNMGNCFSIPDLPSIRIRIGSNCCVDNLTTQSDVDEVDEVDINNPRELYTIDEVNEDV